MSFDYKTFDPKTFQAYRPIKLAKQRTIIGAETTEEFIRRIQIKIPQNAQTITAIIEYALPITRALEEQLPQTTPQYEAGKETDPTHTILMWKEFAAKVGDEITTTAMTPPTTEEALNDRMRILQAALMEMFEYTTWLFLMKGDFFAVQEMNRLSPDYRFATEWTPANELLFTTLMEGINQYLTDWTNDIRTEAAEAIASHAGQSSQQIGDAVAQVLYSQKHRGTLIAKTEIMRAFNRMAYQRYEDAGLESDWLTAHDLKVCELCEAKNGRPTSEVGIPPEHPECRCTVVPRLRET